MKLDGIAGTGGFYIALAAVAYLETLRYAHRCSYEN